jgi:hypothetical protein
MAKKSRPTLQKREKEKNRIQKRKEKEARRLESKEAKSDQSAAVGGEDPDIAGILPGPQPLPEQWYHDHLVRGDQSPLADVALNPHFTDIVV